ncbi:MAG: dITP/XTP pyrophosphatase [Chlamydiia bacterium]|nr:dITP/XTP pyrophosphatase [Chlamydiia bacterium]MCH9618303.1 dITP/XTP pyrophosphatase [Chlamydiia bacterium]MCH9624176.1 dITP/XTP pyrophosphatase [Chlamydiia bacterium]
MKKRRASILVSTGDIMKLLLATSNLHKTLELKAILKSLFKPFDLYSLRDLKDYTPPKETEDSFEGNAKLKAIHAAKFSGMLTISDDSGLVVPSLDGAPGVFSARFAGDAATDKENINKLLEEMKNLEGPKRNAYYSCTLCLATPEKVIKTVTGVCEGRLLDTPSGAGGFGYDSLFVKHDYNHTFAEITEDIKLKISHRRRAFDKIKNTLEAEFHCTTL